MYSRDPNSLPLEVSPYPGEPPRPYIGPLWHEEVLFHPSTLSALVNRNAMWLQTATRTTRQIFKALFPCLPSSLLAPVTDWNAINLAMWDAGYTPSDKFSFNPGWYLNQEP
jgi:hypothetical protein